MSHAVHRAYTLRPERTVDKSIVSIDRATTIIRSTKSAKRFKTEVPGVTLVGCDSVRGEYVLVEKDGIPAGMALFTMPAEAYADHAQRIPKLPKLRVPHVDLLPEARSAGVASLVYSMWLNSGGCFMTLSHTTAASNLWDRLASKYREVYYDLSGQAVVPPSKAGRPDTVRILLGKGVNARTL